MERTLAIIKPDAVADRKMGAILARLEEEGFRVRAARLVRMDAREAGEFYAVHRERPFYGSLKRFMSSGPVLALLLERADAIVHLRQVIGATDPAEAEPGTIRAVHAASKERNAIHASDSAESARHEIAFFFSELDILQGVEPPE